MFYIKRIVTGICYHSHDIYEGYPWIVAINGSRLSIQEVHDAKITFIVRLLHIKFHF